MCFCTYMYVVEGRLINENEYEYQYEYEYEYLGSVLAVRQSDSSY